VRHHRHVHLRKLDNGRWRVEVYKNGRKASATARTKAEATTRGVDLLLELGGKPSARGMTVQELAANWLAQTDNLSVTYRTDAQRVIERLPDEFTSRLIVDITPSVIEGLYRQLAKAGWTVDRIRRAHTVLSSAWTMARRYEWATVNPFTAARRPSAPKRAVEPPTIEQVQRLLAADSRFVLFLEVAAITGARRGEVIGLQWADVQSDSLIIRRSVAQSVGELHVTDGKTGSKGHRVVAIGPELVDALKAHRRVQVEQALAAGLPSPVWIFSHDAGVSPWRPDYASREFRRLRTRLGLPDSIRLHDLRHFVATALLAAGIPLKTVSERLGHHQLSTTSDRYGHWVPAADRAATDVLSSALTLKSIQKTV
jgi:integrase